MTNMIQMANKIQITNKIPIIMKIITKQKDKFFYYSGSADKLPGKGIQEIGNPEDYEELAKIKDWRKVLSNFHLYLFKYDGYTFNTIEHAFHYEKTKLVCKMKAFEFTIESGTTLGLADGSIAKQARKLVLLNRDQLSLWDEIKHTIMKKISIEKYNQCPLAVKVLLATKNAELWHIISRSTIRLHVEYLEKIRDSFK